jgi:hypothetical protein
MAKIKNPLFSEKVSGKASGGIFQTWRGLNVFRKFTMPTIRHTETQMARRTNFGSLSVAWGNVLSALQRTAWEKLDLRIKDIWGDDVNTTGLNLYQRINGVLKDAGKTLLEDPPTTQAMEAPVVTPTFVAGSSKIVIAKPTAGEVSEYAPFFEVWVAGTSVAGTTVANVTEIKTTGVKQSINPAKNLYRRVCFIDENSTTDQTVNFAGTEGAALAGDIKIAAIVVRYTKDGMRSVVVRTENITIAA